MGYWTKTKDVFHFSPQGAGHAVAVVVLLLASFTIRIIMSDREITELKVIFYYVAVNLHHCTPAFRQTLFMDFPGSNATENLAVWCAMGASDLDDLIEKLAAKGKRGELFYLGLEDGLTSSMMHLPPEPMAFTSWLLGTYREGVLWLSYQQSD